MSQKLEKNYYELLKVTPTETAGGIEKAYNEAKSLYSKDSVAFYSLFSNEEREAVLEEINDAYNTLKDPVKRRAYDDKLVSSGGKSGEESILHLYDTVSESSLDGCQTVTLKKPLVVMDESDPVTVEQYRILYTKIEQISQRNSYKSFAITSALKGEGKTSTCMNIAYLMAHEFKKKVLLIECDLKNPSISSNFLEGRPKNGLIDVITGNAELNDSIAQLDESNLYVLPAGGHVRNSSELLSSTRMGKILTTLKEEYDYLIIDSPPILSLADMNILSKLVDGLILVVRAGETPKDIVLKAVNSVSGGDLIGVILNRAEISMNKYQNYYY